jgi:hypothetical protein
MSKGVDAPNARRRRVSLVRNVIGSVNAFDVLRNSTAPSKSMKKIQTISDTTYEWTSFVPDLGEFLYPSLLLQTDSNSQNNLHVSSNPVQWKAVPLRNQETMRKKKLAEELEAKWVRRQQNGEELLRKNQHPGKNFIPLFLFKKLYLCFHLVTKELYSELLKPPEVVESEDGINSEDEFHKSSDSDDSADDFLCSSNVTPDVYDVAKVCANVVLFSIRIINSLSVFM